MTATPDRAAIAETHAAVVVFVGDRAYKLIPRRAGPAALRPAAAGLIRDGHGDLLADDAAVAAAHAVLARDFRPWSAPARA